MSDQLVTNMDLTYSVRMIRLLKKSWTEWTAYKMGIIDGQGDVLRLPKTKEEKAAYSPFHRSVRHIKRRLNAVPFLTGFTDMRNSYDALRNRYNLTEEEHETVMFNVPLLKEFLDKSDEIDEAMVSGDAGGDPGRISSGETSGDITRPAPETLPNDKDKKKKRRKLLQNQ